MLIKYILGIIFLLLYNDVLWSQIITKEEFVNSTCKGTIIDENETFVFNKNPYHHLIYKENDTTIINGWWSFLDSGVFFIPDITQLHLRDSSFYFQIFRYDELPNISKRKYFIVKEEFIDTTMFSQCKDLFEFRVYSKYSKESTDTVVFKTKLCFSGAFFSEECNFYYQRQELFLKKSDNWIFGIKEIEDCFFWDFKFLDKY
jgi:hypothetical protein